MTISFNRLGEPLGAEVLGVDLAQPLEPETVKDLYCGWLEHLVLVFRGQTLSETDEIAFARAFGEVQPTNRGPGTPLIDNPEFILAIGNARNDKGEYLGTLPDGDLTLHSDSLWLERPPKATMLYGIEVPSRGGDTIFANMYRAYDTLPDDLKRAIEGKRAIHSYHLGARYRGDSLGAAVARGHAHPAVIRHPETGRKAVYVNRLMTVGLEGVQDDEARDILEGVFAHCERPEFRYEHVWRQRDLVMWDNRCCLHGRNDFNPAERRFMKRVVVQDTVAPTA